MRFSHLITLAALAVATPVVAQPAPLSPQPGVANANNAAAVRARQQNNMNANDNARYQEDRAAYLTALRRRNRHAAVDAHIQDRRERAYADAMYAWRVQVADCRRGKQSACKAPTPDPANFW
jgi:hypothetical protein